MQKFLLFLTAFAFLASTLYAAPARNARTGSGTQATTQKRVSTPAKRTSVKKATTKKRVVKKQEPQQRIEGVSKLTAVQEERGKEEQLGLMPSEVDYLNRPVFYANAASIRGAREAEQALRYIPFVTITNTAGFGQGFDIRGQGRLSANGVKMFINGVPVNPVDAYQSPMPLNTIIPSNIQEIEVFPGSGAVLYGSGTKGGVVNVITSKRQTPYFLVGAGYLNTTSGKGHSFNAYAQAMEKFGNDFSLNAALAFSRLGGPRESDTSTNAQASIGAEYKFGLGNAITLDADVYYGKVQTTPYNSLLDFTNINTFMLSTISLPATSIGGTQTTNPYEQNRYYCLAGLTTCSFGVNDYNPSADDRATDGYGTIDTTQLRATAKLNYFSQLASRLEFNLTGFGNFDSKKYNDYTMNLPYFVLGYIDPQNTANRGYNWFLPRPTHPYRTGAITDTLSVGGGTGGTIVNGLSSAAIVGADGPIFGGELGDGQRADWHYFDQSGSKYNDYKFGAKARIDWRHTNGLFLFGLDFTYEKSDKNTRSYLRQAIVDGSALAGIAGYNNNYADGSFKYSNENQFSSLAATILDEQDINVMTAGVYFLERYDFTREFSLGIGARYEMKNYDIKITDNFEGKKIKFMNTSDTCNTDGHSCDFVDYNSGTLLQTTNKAGVNNPDGGIATFEAKGDYSKNYDNFTFELAPVYRYSNTGSAYLRGEIGYNAPPAWAMLRRIGIVWGASRQRDVWQKLISNATGDATYGKVLEFDFDFEETQLESETYYTAELGWKDAILNRQMPLGLFDLDISALLFSASLFYTGSQNEFYFEGDTWSGMTFGNYKESRRYGAELAFEQILYNGAINLNESFTYLKAEKKNEGEDKFTPIPYTYDWKATLGISVDIGGYIEIIDMGLALWLQNSVYGNQNIYAQRINVIDSTYAKAAGIQTEQDPYFMTVREEKKLDPYLVSDIGLSLSLNKGMGLITVGVKNVFDTFYYDYYNNDRSAVVNENRYVIGRGRTVFVEGQFKY